MYRIAYLLMFLSSFGIKAQKIDERPLPFKVGECSTKNTYLIAKDDKSLKVFEIEVPQDGNYFLEALLLVSKGSKYSVQVDEKPLPLAGAMGRDVQSWQFVSLEDVSGSPYPITLIKGLHTITFSTSKPFVPLVDVIALSRTQGESLLNRQPVIDYLTKLQQSKLPDNYNVEKRSSKSNRRVQANPEGQYEYNLGHTYNSTAIFQHWFDGGTPYNVNTKNTNTDPVLYIFYSSDPSQGSWSDDDSGGGYNSSITFTPSVSGYYTILVKTYGYSQAGTADLYFNTSLGMSGIPVNGNWRTISPKNGEVNFFTSHASGSPHLLVTHSETSPILGYNSFYYPWYQYSGYSQSYSRVRGNFSGQVEKALPISGSIYNPSGVCDLYMNCEMVPTNSYIFTSNGYPDLNADDAIKTANSTNTYNCYAWAAGISPNGNVPPGTYSWSYPPNEVIAGYPANDTPLGSMDDFLGNNPPRYAGAWTYTRSGADANNATIALWATSSEYTHLSIRKPGNDHPHGYDWESKMSGDERMMHPKNAIAGNQLGQIVAYYRIVPPPLRLSAENSRTGAEAGISLEESLEQGLSVMEEQQWKKAELELLQKLTDAIAPSLQEEFASLYQSWVAQVKTPVIRSTTDQQSHRKLKEYAGLKNWLNNYGSAVYPLLINQFFKEPVYAIEAILGLTMEAYRPQWKEVGEENRTKLYDERGRYLVRSQSTNCARYIQKILPILKTTEEKQLELLCSPNPVSTHTTIEFYLPTVATVSLQISSESGQPVALLLEQKTMAAGWHQIFWEGMDRQGFKVRSGAYPLTLTVENQRKTIQMIVH